MKKRMSCFCTGLSSSRKNCGAVLPMTALMAVFLISMIAIVVDLGFIYFHSLRVQTAVNAAWKAGVDKIVAFRSHGESPMSIDNQTIIEAQVREVILANGYNDDDLTNLGISISNDGLSISLKKRMGLFFARVIDIDSSTVASSRGFQTGLNATLPLTMPHGIIQCPSPGFYVFKAFKNDESFELNKEYILSPGLPSENAASAMELPARVIKNSGCVLPTASLSSPRSKNLASDFSNGLYSIMDPGDSLIPISIDFSPVEALQKRILGKPDSEDARKVIVALSMITHPDTTNASGAQTVFDLDAINLPLVSTAEGLSKLPAESALKISGFAEFRLVFPGESSQPQSGSQPIDRISSGQFQSDQIRGEFLRYIVKPGELFKN